MGLIKFFLPLLLCSTVVIIFVEGELETCGSETNCWKLNGVTAKVSVNSDTVIITIEMQKEKDKDIWGAVGLSGETGMRDMFVVECQYLGEDTRLIRKIRYAWSDSEVKPTQIYTEVGTKLVEGGGVDSKRTKVFCTLTLEKGKAVNFKTTDGKKESEIKDNFYVNVAVGDKVGEKHTAAERTGSKVAISGLHIVLNNKDLTVTVPPTTTTTTKTKTTTPKALGGFKMEPILPPVTFLLLVMAFYFGM